MFTPPALLGETATERIGGRTKVVCPQLAPLSVERKTPHLFPAKRSMSLTAREFTLVSVRPVCVQLVPSFVERKTPPVVPAKRFLPLAARDRT
jgi:hypothetical protein